VTLVSAIIPSASIKRTTKPQIAIAVCFVLPQDFYYRF